MKYKVIPKSGMAILKKIVEYMRLLERMYYLNKLMNISIDIICLNFLKFQSLGISILKTDILENRIFLDKDDSGEYKISGDIVNKIKVIRFNEGMLRKVCKFLKFLKN